MKPVRRLVTVATVAVLGLALFAGPAPAKGSYTYFATIDCGQGPVDVGSGDDLWAQLVDLESGKRYKPVAWHVSVEDFVLDEIKQGHPRKRAADCTYSDGVATGEVVVKDA